MLPPIMSSLHSNHYQTVVTMVTTEVTRVLKRSRQLARSVKVREPNIKWRDHFRDYFTCLQLHTTYCGMRLLISSKGVKGI